MNATGHSVASFKLEELLRCSEGSLFSHIAPRLPAPPLLAFDEITEISGADGAFGRGFASARKDLASFEWIFDSHFVHDPIFPGALMIDGLLQLAGFFGGFTGLSGKGRAARIGDVRFLNEVTPAMREIVFRVDVRKRSKKSGLIVADGSVSTLAGQCVTVRQLWVVIQ